MRAFLFGDQHGISQRRQEKAIQEEKAKTMLSYEVCLVYALALAVLLNLSSVRSIYLCFIAIGFLIVIPSGIPETPPVLFFSLSIALESAFAAIALLTNVRPCRFIAAACGYNAIAHAFAWWCWHYGSDLYSGYDLWLMCGESVQVLALIISSKPITAFIINKHKNCIDKERHRDYRLAANSG